MKTHLIEVTNGEKNWGKFLIGQFDHEWERVSAVDHGHKLLRSVGWAEYQDFALVLDIQTGEGAMFRLGGLASADLNKHRIWVCPMYEPFLQWLYDFYRDEQAKVRGAWWDHLPLHVDLPAAPFAMHGYRRTGEGA
jgi:hypothetical protein